jgi:hypothetical protein
VLDPGRGQRRHPVEPARARCEHRASKGRHLGGADRLWRVFLKIYTSRVALSGPTLEIYSPGDQYFGFQPERGIHDIHMMQGNSGKFASDNRVLGDGACSSASTAAEKSQRWLPAFRRSRCRRMTTRERQSFDGSSAPRSEEPRNVAITILCQCRAGELCFIGAIGPGGTYAAWATGRRQLARWASRLIPVPAAVIAAFVLEATSIEKRRSHFNWRGVPTPICELNY